MRRRRIISCKATVCGSWATQAWKVTVSTHPSMTASKVCSFSRAATCAGEAVVNMSEAFSAPCTAWGSVGSMPLTASSIPAVSTEISRL